MGKLRLNSRKRRFIPAFTVFSFALLLSVSLSAAVLIEYEIDDVSEILKRLSGKGVLTVGEMPGFLEQGGA